VIDLPKTRRFSDPFLALLGVRILLWLAATRAMLPGLFKDAWKLAAYHDEHFHYAHEEIARITIGRFHELPAWNPYFCGGIPGIANPQDASLGPEFVLKLIFGVGPGRHLAYLLFVILGMEGTYRLARRLDASVVGAALAGCVFATSGFFLDVLKLGWLNFYSFELVPWVALAFLSGLRGADARPWRVAGGVVVGWMVLMGGTYTVPYTVLLLGVLAAITTVQILTRGRSDERLPWHAPAEAFATIGVVSVAISAAKLLPMLKVVSQAPRIWEMGETNGPQQMLDRLLRVGPFDGQPGYVGGFVLAFALIGAALDRRAALAIGVAGVFFFLAMGDFAEWSPHQIIHKLPVFAQLRSPHRFVVIVALFACVGAGIALGRLEDLFPAIGRVLRGLVSLPGGGRLGPLGRLAFGAAGALLTAKIALFAWESFVTDAKLDSVWVMDTPRRYDAPFRQSRGNRWDEQAFAPASLGSLQCFEETAFPQSAALTGDAKQEEYAADPSVATVERRAWSPNAITLHVVASAEATILVNQNWHPAWSADVGQVRAENGLLAVRVPAGDHQVRLRFRDRLVIFGFVVSSLAWLGVAAFTIRAGLTRLRAGIARLRAAPWLG
jgi:hypothetical protein